MRKKLFCVHCSCETPVMIYNAPIFVECEGHMVAESLAVSHCKDVLHWPSVKVELVSLIPHYISSYEPNR